MERKKLVKMVRSARNGDHKAIDTLFNAYYNDVYYFALKTVKDEETACEVTQDTFVSILKNLKDLKEPAAFVTWMKQIAYNHCARFFQKKKEVLVDEDEEGNTVFDAVPEERTEFVPDEALDQEDFRKTILGMLDELSPEQRSATMLYYYSEMSVKQIAQIQGVSEGTVKSRLNYARKAIKKSVEDYEKKNDVKLHSVALLPLLFWMFAGAKAEMSAAAVPVMVGEISSATGIALTAGSTGSTAAGAAVASTGGLAAKLAGVPLATKIIAGVASISLTIGGIGAAIMHSNQKSPEATDPICQHQWVDADCKVPKTCSLCGATEGGALGHTWIDANCEAPKTCAVCGKTDGEPLGHTWTDASCEAPKTCAVCGKTDGEALGHSWTDASYQSAPVCLTCGAVAGDPLVPDFVTYGLNVITPQYGIEYEYVTACVEDLSQKTVGKLYFSNYRTFEAEEGFEAEDGYEWHSVVAEIRFDDDNAWDYGPEVRTCFECYYDIVGRDESSHSAGEGRRGYSVNYNGIEYTQCLVTSSGARLSGWQGKTNWYFCEFYWRVPIGYDGFVLGFRDAAVTWENGQHIFDIADENTLLFRFEADGAMSNDPPKPTDYVPEGCTYVRPNGVTLQAGEAMPTTIYDGDELITPEYIYKYGYKMQRGGYAKSNVAGWCVTALSNERSEYPDLYGTINGAPLVYMSYAFAWDSYIKKAPHIPDTVIDLSCAFLDCTSLETIPSLPDALVTMENAFSGCTSLKTIPDIPKGVTNMLKAFSNCESLVAEIVVPSGVNDLSWTFVNCKSLVKAPVISSGILDMSYAFYGCASMKNAPNIPEGVFSVDHAFFDCESMQDAPHLPSSLTEMGNAFMGCKSMIGTPNIPEGIWDLSNTFTGCESMLVAPEIPYGVTYMYSAFHGCHSLKTAPVLPDSVTDISYAFSNCLSLTTIPELPDSIIEMCGAFSSCSALEIAPEIPAGVTDILGTFEQCISLRVAPDIPDGVTNMTRAFADCFELEAAPKIPSSVTHLGEAFRNCFKITEPPKLPDGVLYLYNTFYGCSRLTHAPEIPASVIHLADTFNGCTALTGEIIIHASPEYYDNCFSGTRLAITLRGESMILEDLAATAENGNVTVE